MVIFLDRFAAASVPRSYSGERLRIAPVSAVLCFDGASYRRAAGKVLADFAGKIFRVRAVFAKESARAFDRAGVGAGWGG